MNEEAARSIEAMVTSTTVGEASSAAVALCVPAFAVVFLLQRRPPTLVVALVFAFGWLLSVSAVGAVFVAAGRPAGGAGVAACGAVVAQEVGRYGVFRLYRWSARKPAVASLKLDDGAASLAAGFGAAALHAIFLYGAQESGVAATLNVVAFAVLDVALAGLLFCSPRGAACGPAASRLEALFYDSAAAPYAKLGAAVALHGAATLCSYARTAGGYYARAVAAPGSLAAPAVAAVLAWRGRTRVFPLASGIRAAAAAPS